MIRKSGKVYSEFQITNSRYVYINSYSYTEALVFYGVYFKNYVSPLEFSVSDGPILTCPQIFDTDTLHRYNNKIVWGQERKQLTFDTNGMYIYPREERKYAIYIPDLSQLKIEYLYLTNGAPLINPSVNNLFLFRGITIKSLSDSPITQYCGFWEVNDCRSLSLVVDGQGYMFSVDTSSTACFLAYSDTKTSYNQISSNGNIVQTSNPDFTYKSTDSYPQISSVESKTPGVFIKLYNAENIKPSLIGAYAAGSTPVDIAHNTVAGTDSKIHIDVNKYQPYYITFLNRQYFRFINDSRPELSYYKYYQHSKQFYVESIDGQPHRYAIVPYNEFYYNLIDCSFY